MPSTENLDKAITNITAASNQLQQVQSIFRLINAAPDALHADKREATHAAAYLAFDAGETLSLAIHQLTATA